MKRIAVVFLVLVLAASSSAHADGMLDPSFGNGGIVITDFPPSSSGGANAVLVLPDGRAVAVGWVGNLAFGVMIAVRYLPSGALDPAFGSGGMASHAGGPFPNGAFAEDVLLQPDGRLVLVGTFFNGPQRYLSLVRLMPNGSPDPTFGTNGYVNAVTGTAIAGALQPDGRIVAVGNPGVGFPYLIATRNQPNGSLDPTFGIGGLVTMTLPQSFTVRDVVLQPDGKLVIGGTYNLSDFIVVRLLPSGTPDPSFDGDGVAISNFGGTESGNSVIIQPDGRIVLAGARDGDFALVRYMADGSLDTTFGIGGLATGGSAVSERAEDVILQPNGKLLVAGFTSEAANEDFELARFLPNGVLDTSFGTNGLLRTDLGSFDECFALSLAGPDLVLTAGVRGNGPSPIFPASFALARYIATTPVELLGFEVE
jgi:uncharacterized delta-60 repeat protein